MKNKIRIIALCCTYYQLIVMMQIKKTIYSDAEITVLLSDDSINSQRIASKLSKERIFSDVHYVQKKMVTASKNYHLHRLKHLYYCINGSGEFSFLRKKNYDKFMLFNWDMYSYWIYAVVAKYNKNILVSAYEEGLISYERACEYKKLDNRNKYRLVRLIRTLLKRPSMCDSLVDFYCFYPQLYKGYLPTVRIPSINLYDECFIEKLCNCFELDRYSLAYKEKFLYFASLLDSEGGGKENGEVEIALEISRIVGPENLLVKVHPREDKKKYIQAGLKVDINSSIPFELCQFIYDFSRHVFITAMSGAVLTVNSVVNNPARVFFVYNLYAKKSDFIVEWSSKYLQLIRDLKSLKILDNCTIIQNHAELKKALLAANSDIKDAP